jgi:DNA mismatch repair ATPase MutS
LDEVTIKNLELLSSSYEWSERYSLFHILNTTKTAGGTRLLHHLLTNPLTGGQIDNVYRKSQISALVNGTRVSVQSVKEYCEQERNTRAEGRTGKIGFLKSAG